MTDRPFIVRPATPADLPAAAVLAARMVRQHHAYDPRRFVLFDEPIEHGYERWLTRELTNADALILVAVPNVSNAPAVSAAPAEASGVAESSSESPAVWGYAYARAEPFDWVSLRAACGFLHDLYIADAARHRGVAQALVKEVAAVMRARGLGQLVLETAMPNLPAQTLFRRLGFRPTMMEMTLELDAPADR